jgi:hypothetical protein
MDECAEPCLTAHAGRVHVVLDFLVLLHQGKRTIRKKFLLKKVFVTFFS